MRVVIFGAGGVGGYFGARLAAAGTDVTFIARGRHLAALRRSGLAVKSPAGDLRLRPVDATDDPRSVAPGDVVLLTTKTWQLDAALPFLSGLLAPVGAILPLLNGIETGDRLAESLSPGRVLKGLARIVSRVSGPGVITHVGVEPTIVFKEFDNTPSRRTASLSAELSRAGLRAVVPDDIDEALWEKFLFVVSIGGVGAVARAPVGVVRRDPARRAMLQAAMEEVRAVARARGVALGKDVVSSAMRFLDGMPAEATASLQRDLADGRRSELDAWTGAVVRLGRAAEVPTPVHVEILARLRPQEEAARRAAGSS
ncbi:MAG: 2-dehydropantoate 2-reductase [Acidobacteriota bacterium]